eukprot:3621123-Karenia_brevis.AAC.1
MLSYALAHDIRVRLANRVRIEEEKEHIDIQVQEYLVPLDPYSEAQVLGMYGSDYHASWHISVV